MIPMLPTLEALAVAGMLAATPAPTPLALPKTSAAARAPVVLELDAKRLALTGTRGGPRGIAARIATDLGASLAWDLADLPRRQARLPEPIGGFRPGAAFLAHLGASAVRDGDAIDVLIRRWNTIYPPYALEGTNDH